VKSKKERREKKKLTRQKQLRKQRCRVAETSVACWCRLMEARRAWGRCVGRSPTSSSDLLLPTPPMLLLSSSSMSNLRPPSPLASIPVPSPSAAPVPYNFLSRSNFLFIFISIIHPLPSLTRWYRSSRFHSSHWSSSGAHHPRRSRSGPRNLLPIQPHRAFSFFFFYFASSI